MDTSRLTQIETCANELARAAKRLTEYCQSTRVSDAEPPAGFPSIAADSPSQAHRERRSILANVAKLQTLISEPGHFLEQLTSQNQLLASLHWLGEFQVLACIPLQGSVPAKDVAELTGVPESMLLRVVRMTSTAGFLCEPRPRHVAHTTLSAGFISRPSLGDAAMFLSGTAARAALHMAAATRRYGELERGETSHQTAFALAEKTPQSFRQGCEQRPRLERQWAAYLRCSSMGVDDKVAEVLSRLDWEKQRSTCIIQAGPHPSRIVQRMAERCSHLHITVQISEPLAFNAMQYAHAHAPGAGSGNVSTSPSPSPPSLSPSRVTVQRRAPGQPQTVKNAGVYVLDLGSPSTSPAQSLASLTARVTGELLAHLPILRDNRGATLVVAMRLLPDPGSVDAGVEAAARTRDLLLLQLANERDLEVRELVDLVQGVGDASGRLAVVSRARGPDNSVVALGVKFQASPGTA